MINDGKKITVLHNGGGWITNIGNAFLDFGSMESIRKAIPNAEVHLTSVLNRWISHHVEKGISGMIFNKSVNLSNVFNLQNYGKIDYIVQSGAFLGTDWFDLHGEVLLKLTGKGVRLIINGGGMTDHSYSEQEIEKTREYLKKLKPYIFISREKKSFDNFKDLSEYSYNGIDCAFFLNDCHRKIQLDIDPYVILNFDKTPEPPLEKLKIENNKKIVRTHHSFWHNFSFDQYFKMKEMYYGRENTMISEIPHDYLNLYANTDATYSDRVHACVATFSFGNPARLLSSTPRSLLLERIGSSGVLNKLTMPNTKKIEEEKERQISFLSEIFEG